MGADYKFQLKISIHAQFDTKIDLFLHFYVFFQKGPSLKTVAMVTRKGLSLIFFFQSVHYRFIGELTKFQEKNFVISSVILEKPRGGA